jgi:L-aspartate oxidase
MSSIHSDLLVLGSGIAGLTFAIKAARHFPDRRIVVLTKTVEGESNTRYAQGGVAAVWDAEKDNFEKHVADTLDAGDGLCKEEIVRIVVEEGPLRVQEIIDWGTRFDKEKNGKNYDLAREGGHSEHRILHYKDLTGSEIQRALMAEATKYANIEVLEHYFALDLITQHHLGRMVIRVTPGIECYGCYALNKQNGEIDTILARATIVCTGGAGQVYKSTTNPVIATGDGVAMAYRAGASVADMAFIQFHPTTLYLAGAARSLITEAVRGAGAHLVDADGDRFMLGEHPQAELAPRDIVTRGIVRRLAAKGLTHAFLDARHVPDFARAFPGITELLAKFDLNPARDLIPVHPAAHYLIGGVHTDLAGRSSIPGLYVVGESASTGLHGANRLASNSLLEGLVFGEIAGRTAIELTQPGNRAALAAGDVPPGWRLPPRAAPVPIISYIPPSEQGELDLADVESSLRSAMWRNAGIERNGTRLRDTVEMISFWGRYTLDKVFDDTRGWQIQNMLTVAWLIARSAHWRTESRGCHWRSDFPTPDDRLLVHDLWTARQSEPRLFPRRGAQPTGSPQTAATAAPVRMS